MTLRVSREAFERMRAAARDCAPEECCGLLLGRDGRAEEARPAANVAAEPCRRFEIDPQILVDAHRAARAGGADVVGYYHSHPVGPSEPSAADRTMASGDARVWAIVAPDGMTFWRDDEDGFAPLPYVVEDR